MLGAIRGVPGSVLFRFSYFRGAHVVNSKIFYLLLSTLLLPHHFLFFFVFSLLVQDKAESWESILPTEAIKTRFLRSGYWCGLPRPLQASVLGLLVLTSCVYDQTFCVNTQPPTCLYTKPESRNSRVLVHFYYYICGSSPSMCAFQKQKFCSNFTLYTFCIKCVHSFLFRHTPEKIA